MLNLHCVGAEGLNLPQYDTWCLYFNLLKTCICICEYRMNTRKKTLQEIPFMYLGNKEICFVFHEMPSMYIYILSY